jgi:hypothetical protein
MVPTIQANKKVWNSVCSTATAFAWTACSRDWCVWVS